MRPSTWRLDDLRTVILNLGYVGENLHTRIIIDCKKMFDQYPNASVSMTVTPPEGEPYPGLIERDGDLVIWDVRDCDLVAEGDGEIQLVFTQEPHIARSYNARTHICRSQVPTGSIPSGLDDYITRANQVLDEAEAATAAAEDAAEHQPIIDDNGYWAVWDADAEEYVATEYKAQGTDGHDGVGIVSIEKTGTSGLVDTYTITFTSGDPVTYTVTNGRDADPAEIIDDNAGSGDTDKVWSADKSHALLTEINSKADKTVTDALQKDKAPVIIDSAVGNPIVLTDGADGLPVEGMKIHFLPVQDLHGYDSPWPAGGGKNKFNISSFENIVKNGITFSFVNPSMIHISGTATANAFMYSAVGDATFTLPAGDYVMSTNMPSGSSNGWLRLYTIIGGASTNIVDYCRSGSNKTFTLQEETVVAPQVIVASGQTINADVWIQIESGSTATDYAPYSNICPISGWMGLTAWRTGKNLLNPALLKDQSGWNTFGIKVKPNTQYTASTTKPKNNGLAVYFNDSAMDGGSSAHGLSNEQKVTITSTADGFVYISQRKASGDASFADFDFQIEEGSTASSCAEYTGESYPVTFPEIIYGGTPDVVNGVLTVDMAYHVLLSTSLRNYDSGYSTNVSAAGGKNVVWFKNVFSTLGVKSRQPGGIKAYCNAFPIIFNSTNVNASQNRCAFIVDGVTINSVASFIDAIETMENNGENLYIAYELATPIEIQLDPIAVQTILGYNTIWSDANGTIELDYRADTKLFCQKNDQVNDVQVNGTTILDEDGVANIPKANDTTLGLVKGRYYGVRINADGDMYISGASLSEIKGGTSNYLPIVPNMQDKSVFYGLAKAAGVDMASSSNPVGTYTDEALVAIQKMLGVYEAPWELIREDTVTNATEADIDITVDGNGNQFELTDAILMFETPQQDNDCGKADDGRVIFYYGTGSRIQTYHGAWTQASGARGKQILAFVRSEGNFVVVENVAPANFNINSSPRYMLKEGQANTNTDSSFRFIDNFAINQIKITAVTGTGHYKIYGKRKWN